ncbi:hypothetical protein EDF70_105103 [Neorhizobium sp. JUb45]|nr:hypothetical protein EDF70_105103 [Neorhizobium sp. JUb45]
MANLIPVFGRFPLSFDPFLNSKKSNVLLGRNVYIAFGSMHHSSKVISCKLFVQNPCKHDGQPRPDIRKLGQGPYYERCFALFVFGIKFLSVPITHVLPPLEVSTMRGARSKGKCS